MLSVFTNSHLQLSGSVALCTRGDCDYTAKAVNAQLGGAASMLVLNNEEGSF